MEIKPDTIKISSSQRDEIQATHADLFVAVKGSSLVSGDAALKKAREVSQLVDELSQAGLPVSAIQLQSVYAESSGGAILRSSSATYHLRIRCDKLEQFASLLGVITNQKNTTLERVEWQYPDESAHDDVLEKAIQKADAKARKIATALGVRLLGIYTFNETSSAPRAFLPQGMISDQSSNYRSAGMQMMPDLGMDIQHSKTVEIFVEIEYRVSGFEQG